MVARSGRKNLNSFKFLTNVQEQKQTKKGSTIFASSLPQSSKPNQRTHTDFFEPIKTMLSVKKCTLCVTDVFSKSAELVALRSLLERNRRTAQNPNPDKRKMYGEDIGTEMFKRLPI
jgi:hypothetical protein